MKLLIIKSIRLRDRMPVAATTVTVLLGKKDVDWFELIPPLYYMGKN